VRREEADEREDGERSDDADHGEGISSWARAGEGRGEERRSREKQGCPSARMLDLGSRA
jgi:hypothetical protein